MKRVLFCILFLFVFSCTSFAATSDTPFTKPGGTVGVVIISGSDFKTQDFFDYTRETLAPDTSTKYVLKNGSDIQSLYQNYWIDKGFLEEQTPRKDDLLDFVSYSNFDKVVFILIPDSEIDEHRWGIWGRHYSVRASVDFKVFVCDKSDILKALTVTKEADSRATALRARREAFKKAMNEIAETIIPVLNNSLLSK